MATGPANMTHDSLLTDIRMYTERLNDPILNNQLPRLLMMAENRLAVDLKILGVQRTVKGTLTAGDPILPKPSYWRNSVSFNITANNERRPVFLRSYDYCRVYWPTPLSTEIPRFYCDYDFDNFLIVPTPAQPYPFELLYTARRDPLSPDNQINWFTQNAPQLLLYALLLETHIWSKNTAEAAKTEAVYMKTKDAFLAEDASRILDESAERR